MIRSFGFFGSLAAHAVFFIAGSAIFTAPIEYAVEPGFGGIEMSLVAAPSELIAEAVTKAPKDEAAVSAAEPEGVALFQHQIEEKKEALKPQTTFSSAGGALTDSMPNYLRNPAPAYPRAARDKGWQGLVLLKVEVDRSGRPVHIEKEQSSGHAILDESALKTVRKWKFKPAQVGALPVDSVVRVPIRFRLNQPEGQLT